MGLFYGRFYGVSSSCWLLMFGRLVFVCFGRIYFALGVGEVRIIHSRR